jgi:pheromone shutdown-related protein TraB
MKQIENITIVGTSHVSKYSCSLIKKKFEEIKPDVVCVELDKARFESLMNGSYNKKVTLFPMIKAYGFFGGLLFYGLANFQRFIGAKLNSFPGIEMKTAIDLASSNQKYLYLIDQDIQITMSKLKKALNFSFFIKLIKLSFKKQKISINIENPDDDTVKQALKIVKQNFPKLYYALVEERNYFMCRKLLNITEKFDKILVVVGKGHEEGMEKILRKEFEKKKQLIKTLDKN